MFQVPAVISSISTRVDRTLKITVETQELNPEENSKLFGLHQKLGWFCFKENVFQSGDIPKEQAKGFGKELKTESQILRGSAYRYWEKYINDGNFEGWFDRWKRERSDWFKSKL